MEEQWRPIDGFPRYEVSNLGGIRSTRYAPSKSNPPPRVLSKRVNRGGYLVVSLRNENGPKNLLVHRLVMLAFGDEQPPGKWMCLHKDSNPKNSAIDNLYWGDPADNARDCKEARHYHPRFGSNHPNSVLTEEDVVRIKKQVKDGVSIHEVARINGVRRCTIHDILKKKWWKHVPD